MVGEPTSVVVAAAAVYGDSLTGWLRGYRVRDSWTGIEFNPTWQVRPVLSRGNDLPFGIGLNNF